MKRQRGKASGIVYRRPLSADQVLDRMRGFIDDALQSPETGVFPGTYRRGQVMAHQGDTPWKAWYLLAGRVRIVLAGDNGSSLVIAHRGAGEMIGEMGIIEGYRRTASVIAVDDVRAACIPASTLEVWLQDEPAILAGLLVQMSARLRQAGQSALELTTAPVPARVARALFEMGAIDGEERIVIDRCPTVTDLAEVVSASRETVSKILNGWIAAGVLQRVERKLVIVDPLALSEQLAG